VRRASSRGFTLLELLVVLVLLGLVTGLVAPLAVNGLNAARERAVAAEVRALLEGLPVKAFSAGHTQTYDAPALVGLMADVPTGWSISVDAPLQYSLTGVASGGAVSLIAPGRTALRWRVLPVSGEVVEQGARP
jgi:general secretion pathway protein G